ncbi:2-amino-4-hydroxy-6-hydroxymethyldihydropteridine diphosphokinase [Planococcus ruber]|uniref:2-amino-4-hydroxy-6- hydroxymethyldihydropteridine diphosphokinase n=1 Tax=Planococcus ruber TaxID=2027871 RepID=UPI001FEF3F28|nr:2-amino-4-hydroxy-6-hydroxymethyldihydropteridine diphosphokinase [Planococcus ruber]MCJ1908488.1 2-amino-4-hydroxy-6-hydroxymethyldihydropteridine diphosphokinase [Planococcus ruber]
MNISYLSLGSNMGDRFDMLKQAVKLLDQHPQIWVKSISSLYETDPVGYTEQEPFLNMVVCLHTAMTAIDLLDVCQGIEQKLDRKRLIRWGPRTIDLDILLYNQETIETERLVVPHPRMYERDFVLIPLIEIAPSLKEEAKPLNQGVRLWKTYTSVEDFIE